MQKRMKWWMIVLLVLGILLVCAAAGALWVWNANEFTLELNMKGQPEITLEYGSEYADAGADAIFYGTILNQEPTAVPVEIQGQVDPQTLGTYTITYTARHMNVEQSAQRVVTIVDTQNPTITLVSHPDTFTLPGQAYAEEGFSAWDDYDGDLTDKVVRSVTDSQVIYRVSDSSGNTYEICREIVYDDPVSPLITLLGDEKMSVPAGGSFEDPGYTAVDNCDGDITHRVTVTGDIDPYLPGDYTISYTVEDSYGNVATAERTVTVNGIYNTGVNTGKIIYLTFDDGPSAYTSYLLEILKKYGVKATFFVVNSANIPIIARTAAQGHTVAIHSMTHNYGQIYASEEAYFADLYAMQSIIKEYTGKTTWMFRFPGGSSNRVSSFNPGIMTRLTQAVQEAGFYYFDWNVSSGDAGLVDTTQEVFENVINGIKGRKTAVVLQHDSYWYSVQAVERIIVWGLVNGYTFLPMNENSPGCHHRLRN
jgi:peptidoglycan/xylan/chitin deacetylase (PgdA/CDA1 family)